MNNITNNYNYIEPIDCSVQPLGFDLHPTRDIAAVALVDGTLEREFYFYVWTVFFLGERKLLSCISFGLYNCLLIISHIFIFICKFSNGNLFFY